MKIAVLTWWPYPQLGGVTTHIELLVQSLQALGHHVEVVGGEPYPPAASFHDAQAMLARQLTQKVLQQASGVDVVLAEDALSAVAVRDVLHWTDVPLVLTVHGYLAYEEAAAGFCAKGDAVYTYLMAAEHKAYRAADAVICVDERIAQYVGQIRPGQVAVIENAVDDRVLEPPNPEAKWQARRHFGFSERPVLVCARRLTAKNGVRYAIEALSLLPESQRPDFVVAGAGEERGTLESLAAELNLRSQVHFLGSVPHEKVLDLYRAADVAVVPSVPVAGVEEASSLSALEAMALGVPLVASEVGGLRRIGQDGGALLVPPAHPKALCEAVNALLQDDALRSRQGQQGRSTVVARYGREAWIAAHLRVAQEAINRLDSLHQREDAGSVSLHSWATHDEVPPNASFEEYATGALTCLEQGLDDRAWELTRRAWRADAPAGPEPLLMVSSVAWSFLHQRPQQLALEFGKQGRPTIYVEPEAASVVVSTDGAGQKVRAVLAAVLHSVKRVGPNCFRLPFLRHIEDADGRSIADEPQLFFDVLKHALGCDRPWAMVYHPEHTKILDAMGDMGLVVYDSPDELGAVTGAGPDLESLEHRVLERSDITFVASETSRAAEALSSRRVYLVPNLATAQHSWEMPAKFMLAVMEGHHALMQGEWEAACTSFTAVRRDGLPQKRVELDADLAKALAGGGMEDVSAEVHSLGIDWASRGHLESAEALFRHWTGQAPKDADAWFNLASILARLEKWDDAIDSLARYSLLADPDAEVLALLAIVLLSGGYPSSGLRVAQEALQLYPGREDIQEVHQTLNALPDLPTDPPLVQNLITQVLDRARTIPNRDPQGVWGRIFGAMDVEAVQVPSPLALELGPLVQTLVPFGSSLLEAGSGSGGLSAHLAQLAYRTTLLDQSPAALALGRKVYDRFQLQGDFVPGDLFHMPFSDNEFDCVWNSGVMEHFPDDVIVQGLREMARVSRRYVLVLVPNAACVFYRASKWTLEQNGTWPCGDEFPRYSTASLFQQAGLKVLREDYLGMDEGIRWFRHLDGADERTLARLKAWSAALNPADLPLRQTLSYLLVTVGEKI